MKLTYYIKLMKYIRMSNPLLKVILNLLSHFLCNIIRVIEYEFLVIKELGDK